MHMSEITVDAAQQGLIDLDEFGACVKLKEIISGYHVPDLIKITLNLERCWIEYSHAHLFLDEAINLLILSSSPSEKLLSIRTSINLGAPEFMAVFVFRLSSALGCEANDSPSDVLRRVQDFCKNKRISIVIHAIPFPDKPDDIRNQEFVLGKFD